MSQSSTSPTRSVGSVSVSRAFIIDCSNMLAEVKASPTHLGKVIGTTNYFCYIAHKIDSISNHPDFVVPVKFFNTGLEKVHEFRRDISAGCLNNIPYNKVSDFQASMNLMEEKIRALYDKYDIMIITDAPANGLVGATGATGSIGATGANGLVGANTPV